MQFETKIFALRLLFIGAAPFLFQSPFQVLELPKFRLTAFLSPFLLSVIKVHYILLE